MDAIVRHHNGMGLQTQSINQCVEDKTINGKQCTIIWHVDDIKISHVDMKVKEGIINKLNKKFDWNSPLTTTHGNVLKYLGMPLDYTTK